MAISSVARATINAITAKVIEVRNVNIKRTLLDRRIARSPADDAAIQGYRRDGHLRPVIAGRRCCECAVSGLAAATPPSSVMDCRRLIGSLWPTRTNYHIAETMRGLHRRKATYRRRIGSVASGLCCATDFRFATTNGFREAGRAGALRAQYVTSLARQTRIAFGSVSGLIWQPTKKDPGQTPGSNAKQTLAASGVLRFPCSNDARLRCDGQCDDGGGGVEGELSRRGCGQRRLLGHSPYQG